MPLTDSSGRLDLTLRTINYLLLLTNTKILNINKHGKNCESCKSQVTWNVPDHYDHGDHDDHGNHEEVGSYMRKLEVVHKEVGGCLISYNLQLACVRKLEVI